MAPIPVVSANDGPRITVNDFLKDPLRLPTLIIDMAKQGFIADSVLRNAGEVESGAVRFNQNTSPYAADDAVIRGEYAEVPLTYGTVGQPAVAFAQERALGVVVSDRMRRRQTIDPLNRQLLQVRNTMFKSWGTAFMNLLISGASNVSTVTDSWALGTTTATIRKDLVAAKKQIATAVDFSGALFGFQADTMIIGNGTQFDIMQDDTFNKPYVGNIASENLQYTGKLPFKILDMDVLVTPQCPDNKVVLCQRGILGFIADEIPLTASAVYRIEEKKLWRCDVQRASAMGLDQPSAVAVITNTGGV